MHKVYGVSLPNTLVFRDNNKTEYYVDRKQHEQYVAGLYKLLEDCSFLKKFHTKAQEVLERILRHVQKELNKDFSVLSHEQLLRIYTTVILPSVEQFYIRMWTVFNIAEPTATVVQKKLEEKFSDPAVVNKYLIILSTALQPNDAMNERIDLLKLGMDKRKLSSSELKKRVQEHTKKYWHIPLFDFDHEPFTEEYFKNELESISHPEQELQGIRSQFTKNNTEYEKTIIEIHPDKYFSDLIQFMKENVFLRDYRDMIRQKLNLQLRFFYIEVGKRLGLTVEEVAVLTNEEIIKYLQEQQEFPHEEIVRRKEAYVLIQKGNEVKIYSGKKALQKVKEEHIITEQARVKKIIGIPASGGKAQGKVKIIYSNKDLPKVQ
ncbi:MAG: hypothetical protein AABX37_02225, partial [Nanoarchaeota archaeon]